MLLEGTIGFLGGLLGALASALAIVKTLRAPVEALKEKVCRLEQEKVHALEEQFKRHLNEDKSQRMLALLEGIQSNMTGMGVKIDRLCEVSARHEAMIESNRSYVANVDASLQRHVSREE